MLYPLITSLAYIYLYPYPARYVYQFSRSRQKEISDIKRKIEDDTLLTAKESRAVRREIYAAEEEFQKNLERKSSEIERLKMEIEELEKLKIVKEADKQPGNSKENSAYKPELDELSEGQLKMLKLVGNRDGEVAEKQLINNSSDNHIAAKYNLGELESNGYIRQDYSQRLSDYSYELTHKGRSYLVSNGHV